MYALADSKPSEDMMVSSENKEALHLLFNETNQVLKFDLDLEKLVLVA